jgi:hypothetical protein
VNQAADKTKKSSAVFVVEPAAGRVIDRPLRLPWGRTDSGCGVREA